MSPGFIFIHKQKFVYLENGVNHDIKMNSDWDFISHDGAFKKKLILIGMGRTRPSDKSLCKVKFIEISEEEGNPTPNYPTVDSEIELTIGEGETLFFRLLSRALLTVVCREIALFEFSKLDKTICSVKIELLHFEHSSKPIHRLDENEKLNEADRLKSRASNLIREERYEDAVFLLKRAFRCVCWADKVKETNNTILLELYFSVIANLSLCSLKLCDNERTISLCDRVLEHDPRHIKCLLRRATAFNRLEEAEKAKNDVLAVLQTEPHNAAALQLLQTIKVHIAKQKREYSHLVKKMLQMKS